ncbi:MAG: DUF1963 domain-containing protein [Bacteroidales bacterium]|nr:DUF1963 domain-containing protein [Bacteroidales bacterium]
MDIGLAVALAVTLVIAVWLVIKNDLPDRQVQFEKNMASVVFEDENVKDISDLKHRIHQLQMDEYEDVIVGKALEDIRFVYVSEKDDPIPAGTSKIGGYPDMDNISGDNIRSLFLAQINCAECKHEYMPGQGMLYFFIDAVKMQQGAEDMVQCVYVRQPGKSERNATIGVPPLFEACRIHFFNAVSLPEYESEWAENTFEDYKKSAYFKLCNVNQCSKMFGYPMGISSVFDMEDGKTTLLLQLDSDESKNMLWGESGRLYVFIDTDKLKSCDFSQVRACIQDYRQAEG